MVTTLSIFQLKSEQLGHLLRSYYGFNFHSWFGFIGFWCHIRVSLTSFLLSHYDSSLRISIIQWGWEPFINHQCSWSISFLHFLILVQSPRGMIWESNQLLCLISFIPEPFLLFTLRLVFVSSWICLPPAAGLIVLVTAKCLQCLSTISAFF